jgi:hypothetical protein
MEDGLASKVCKIKSSLLISVNVCVNSCTVPDLQAISMEDSLITVACSQWD